MRNSKLDAKGAPAVRERHEATGREGSRFEVVDGAEEGTRTPTAFRSPAPKAGASANSATSALRNSITRDRQALAADVFAVDAPAAKRNQIFPSLRIFSLREETRQQRQRE